MMPVYLMEGVETTLLEFLQVNFHPACVPPSQEEIYALVTAEIGQEVHLAIGGGFMSVKRIL